MCIYIVDVDEFDTLMAQGAQGIEQIFGSFNEWEFDTQVDWVERAYERGYLSGDDAINENKYDKVILEGMLANKRKSSKSGNGHTKWIVESWVYVFVFMLVFGVFALYFISNKCTKNGAFEQFCSINSDEYAPLLVDHS